MSIVLTVRTVGTDVYRDIGLTEADLHEISSRGADQLDDLISLARSSAIVTLPLDGPAEPATLMAFLRRRAEERRWLAAIAHGRQLRAIHSRKTVIVPRSAAACAADDDPPVTYWWWVQRPDLPEQDDPLPEYAAWCRELEREAEARKNEARVHARIVSARLGAIERECRAREYEYMQARGEAIRAVGSADEVERFAAGAMPDDEAEGLVYLHVVRASKIDRLDQQRLIVDRDIHCQGGCSGEVHHGTIWPMPSMADQPIGVRLLAESVREVAARIDGAEVDIAEHYSECAECGGAMSQLRATISVWWHGRVLRMAFALSAPEPLERANRIARYEIEPPTVVGIVE